MLSYGAYSASVWEKHIIAAAEMFIIIYILLLFSNAISMKNDEDFSPSGSESTVCQISQYPIFLRNFLLLSNSSSLPPVSITIVFPILFKYTCGVNAVASLWMTSFAGSSSP